MAEALNKNIVDKDEYPQTAALEARCVAMLADLWHAPSTGKPGAGHDGGEHDIVKPRVRWRPCSHAWTGVGALVVAA